MSYYTGISWAPFTEDVTLPLKEGQGQRLEGLQGQWFNYVSWSRDSRTVAFTLRSPGREGDPPRKPLELWVADTATGQARKLLDDGLNTVFEE